MTDILNSLSLARTALDEGYAYDGVNDTDLGPEEMKLYVIEKIDDIIFALDPESPARALSTLGRMMADVVGEDPPDDGEEENVVRLVQEALDLVDRAIEILEPDSDLGNEDGSNRDVPPFDNDPRSDEQIKDEVYDRWRRGDQDADYGEEDR